MTAETESWEWQVVQAIMRKYGWVWMASCIFYPVYRDFVQGFMMGLLGLQRPPSIPYSRIIEG